jgi:flavin-binding protein dodecin
MTTLASGTQPSVGGTAELTDVVTVTPRIEIPEATDLATTGVFTLSEARPTLTNVEAFNVLESIPEATDLATTGVFTLSEARPTLTNVEAFNVLESIPEINISSQVQWFQLVADAIGTPAVATTRQLLIR